MCTVSVVQLKDQVIITSNRDEKDTRPAALVPQIYRWGSKKIIFPKDPLSGGTWFAVDDRANIAVLLNGAEEKHIAGGNYRKSRGLVLLEIIQNDSPIKYWENINLVNIEPFTIVLLENSALYELRWNGNNKSKKQLEHSQNYLWSSSTLYSKTVRDTRHKWFRSFMEGTGNISAEKLLDFHQKTQANDFENGLKINRKNGMQTLSITQSVVQKTKININYIDLKMKGSYRRTYIKI